MSCLLNPKTSTLTTFLFFFLGACADPPPEHGSGTAPADKDFSCRPDRPFPYAQGAPYLGVHGDPANSDLIDCESAGRFATGWHALQGLGIPQPNTFSPDGATTYVTTTHPEPEGCRVHALDVETGALQWCRSYDPSVSAGSVEVDLDGHLYFTVAGALVSLTDSGEDRWRAPLAPTAEGADDTAWGVHMSPAGHVVTVTTSGTVAVFDRDTGAVLSSLSIPDTWDFPPVEPMDLSLDPALLFPESIVENIEFVFGPTDAESAGSGIGAFLGAGAFVDNTVAISPRGEIYVIGAGPDEETGAMVQIHLSDDDGSLTPGWVAWTRLGSATSPSVSADGRWVVIGDGASLERFLNPDAALGHVRIADIDSCDANTDEDPDPRVCAFATVHAMERDPMAGSPAIAEDGTVYFYEMGLDFDAGVGDRDLVALAPTGEERWRSALPDDLDWTSVVTVTRNHLLGTATAVTHSDAKFLSIPLPATSRDELVVLRRDDGTVVSRLPIPDDSSATVTLGADGSLYVGMLGIFSMLSTEERPQLGLMKLTPAG